jgi:hypothetical protein
MEIYSLTYSGSILNSISAFKRASSDIIITTLSGFASYRLYVANADNSWNTTITTTYKKPLISGFFLISYFVFDLPIVRHFLFFQFSQSEQIHPFYFP